MACILLVDPNDVARRALRGILARGGHRLAMVATPREAWRFVTEHVRVDLVITEQVFAEGNGLAFIQQLKADTFLKLLPVVLYTERSDRETVKQALALRVQNLLVKPYHDDAIYAEIAKTAANPWRARHFEEEKSFCQQMGYTRDMLHRMLEQLRLRLGAEIPALTQQAQDRALGAIKDRLASLATEAETAGAWGLVDYLAELGRLAETEDWPGFEVRLASHSIAGAIITQQLNPDFLPEPFQSREEQCTALEQQARAVWFNASAENRCPVTSFARLQAELDALPGCPVIESTVAAFQMTATGHPSTMNPLMDLVARDPGLATQMLMSAGQSKHQDDFDPTPLEDPRLAVGRLGELRLAALAGTLVTLEERYLNLPPHFTWPQYWIFQMGVARVARFTCQYLGLHTLELQARMGGLLHDFGRLLLAKLHPYAFQAVLAQAREKRVTMSQAEQFFLGCTSHDLAGHFGDKHNLAPAYVSVMRWLDRAEEATSHRQLVAIVALARDLCRQNQVGFGGDTQFDDAPPLEDTAEWRVLRESVFPSFDLRKFEREVHANCVELRQELRGQVRR